MIFVVFQKRTCIYIILIIAQLLFYCFKPRCHLSPVASKKLTKDYIYSKSDSIKFFNVIDFYLSAQVKGMLAYPLSLRCRTILFITYISLFWKIPILHILLSFLSFWCPPRKSSRSVSKEVVGQCWLSSSVLVFYGNKNISIMLFM